MSLRTADEESAPDILIPADVDWKMLDKSKFFLLGAGLFSGLSFALYPLVVLKTRQQICQIHHPISSYRTVLSILRYEGFRGFYKGFGTSLMGTIPARAFYMTALEVTKSSVGNLTRKLGFPDTSAIAIANAAAGLSSAMAAQLVWTPVDVVSQRLMVQGSHQSSNVVGYVKYNNGIDAFRKIMYSDGPRGFYRGFGMSILTYAPSNAVWWASYAVAHRVMWNGIGCSHSRKYDDECGGFRRDSAAEVAVQGLSAAMASGVSALITMPLDTIKTRLQVLDREYYGHRPPSIVQTLENLVKEGGFSACYRGLGPRWASMSMSATTMITTYEFLKRLSTKTREN